MSSHTTDNTIGEQRKRLIISLELAVAFILSVTVYYLIIIKAGFFIASGYAFLLIVPLVTFLFGPLWGFLLYFPTSFVLAIPLPGIPITLNQLAGGLLFIGWLRWWLQGKARLAPTRFFLLLLVAAVYFSLSAVLGADIEEGLVALKSLLIYFFITLILAMSLNRKREVLVFSWIIVVVTFGHALLGFYEYFSGVDILVTTRARFLGTFRINAASPSAVVYGHYLLFAFPFGYYLFSEEKNPTLRLGAVFLTLFIIFVAVLTLSRQVIIVLALQLFLVPLLFRNRFSKIFLIILIAGGILASPYIAHHLIIRLKTMEVESLRRDISLLARSDALKIGKRIVQEHPFFGIGLGSFSTTWQEYCGYDTYMAHFNKEGKLFTDCTYNQLLSETGIVGFVLALGLYVNVLVITWKKRRRAVALNNRALINFTSIILVLIISLLITNIVEDTFLSLRSWMIFGFVLCVQKPWFLDEREEGAEP